MMADQTRSNGNDQRRTSEPPRLHIAHHHASRIEHTGVGEYQVTMSLRVEMVNAQKEMVHMQFLVDGTPQGNPQLLGVPEKRFPCLQGCVVLLSSIRPT